MKGFDPKFKDFPGYIIDITHEIWEGRGLDLIHDYYAEDVIVRTPGGISQGVRKVVSATAATLREFPDRQLLGEDVIWSGSPETGMLSSHRILSTATHDGDGVFGPASGKKLVYRVLVDCHARNNKIDDEWLVRDQSAIVRQLGWSPKEYARDLIAREGGANKCTVPCTPLSDVSGPYKGIGNDSEWGSRLANILQRIVNGDHQVIEKEYDRAAHLEYPGHLTEHGWEAADAFWTGLRSSFPSAHFDIHHTIGRDDPTMPQRAALRWSLTGTHDGNGMFGTPTGANVHVMGITHAEFGSLGTNRPKLRREWTLFDETAVWKQILMQTGEEL